MLFQDEDASGFSLMEVCMSSKQGEQKREERKHQAGPLKPLRTHVNLLLGDICSFVQSGAINFYKQEVSLFVYVLVLFLSAEIWQSYLYS